MVTIFIKSRGHPIKRLPETVELDLEKNTTEDLYAIIVQKTGLDRNRLRITKSSDGSVLPTKRDDGKDVMLEDTGLMDESVVFVKDLGPQIAWRTVFLIEYLGPLLIHPLMFFLRPYIYSNSKFNPLAYIPFMPSYTTKIIPPPTPTQTLMCALITLHFLKREYETLFIHRFSSASMPLRNIFKNSAHYWILSGINLGYFLYAPPTSATSWWPDFLNADKNPIILYALTGLWVLAQVSNLKTHITLRNLRPSDGSTKRQIPKGYGFDTVTCPNYSFEVLGWAAVWALSGGNWAAALFLGVSAGQMALWAMKKERRYRKEFGSAYKKKKVMIPGIL
ncbi:Very-long-chain enoyl-CoA reductase [Rhizina undulata]